MEPCILAPAGEVTNHVQTQSIILTYTRINKAFVDISLTMSALISSIITIASVD